MNSVQPSFRLIYGLENTGFTKLPMDENSLPVVQFVFSSARPLGYE